MNCPTTGCPKTAPYGEPGHTICWIPVRWDERHANATGLIGGFPVCGQQGGLVMADDAHVTCPACLARMTAQGYVLTLEQACPGCRAGVKHIHCRNPWQDEGGGG